MRYPRLRRFKLSTGSDLYIQPLHVVACLDDVDNPGIVKIFIHGFSGPERIEGTVDAVVRELNAQLEP